MIKSKLFENEAQLNEFLNSYVKRSVISIETVTVEVYSELPSPGIVRLKNYEDRLKLWYNSSEQETSPKAGTDNIKPKEPYYICEKEPRHQANTNGIIAGPFNSLEQASEAAIKWGYVGENYLIKIANLCQ